MFAFANEHLNAPDYQEKKTLGRLDDKWCQVSVVVACFFFSKKKKKDY